MGGSSGQVRRFPGSATKVDQVSTNAALRAMPEGQEYGELTDFTRPKEVLDRGRPAVRTIEASEGSDPCP